MYLCVCVCGWGEGCEAMNSKKIIIVICARPTLVALAIAAGVVAESSCLLMHLPFLLPIGLCNILHTYMHSHALACDRHTLTLAHPLHSLTRTRPLDHLTQTEP